TWQYGQEWSHRSVTTNKWRLVNPSRKAFFVRYFVASNSSGTEEGESCKKCFAFNSAYAASLGRSVRSTKAVKSSALRKTDSPTSFVTRTSLAFQRMKRNGSQR